MHLLSFAISARNVAITKKYVLKVLLRVSSIPNAHLFVMVSPSVSQSLINAHHFFCILLTEVQISLHTTLCGKHRSILYPLC